MVASHDVRENLGVPDLFHQRIVNDEIVDAPTGVFLASMESVAPPGIGDLIWVKFAERVLVSLGE